jgi:hypothetical protein
VGIMMWWLGVDPGKTGAVALVRYPDIRIFDWDGVMNTSAKIREWQARFEIAGAYLEDVHAMPNDGNVSAFRFGRNRGAWEGILCALQIQVKTVSPKQWRKGLYLPGDRRPLKKRSLDAAVGLFSDNADLFSRAMDHNRAEAALIAYQCERFFYT